ncbi:MFS transporter [Oceanobacillus caeni]|uniref:MFS transporter n=1 Tax=Oceanobacillus TaxID=182709 RepID=UPI000622B2F0|nr:MFS transporter [Oceanobacillus caeni]KKE80266.1 MFS transporter [Bacilli bacterium VT-13-104]PZD87973.1 MFS transporter [Bacilli bacterium]MBU8789409.1 MFS transporter [Oceanobacillus caeni]MCR1832806.1 MFS transporter [Oceanobacillus caeni]PZD90164.1 MFS transporter [Bacilli bacterium]
MDNQNSKFRWIVFASVLCSYLLMSSLRTAPGLITDQLMADFSVTATTVGLVTSIQFFVYTALQIPMGILTDRYGPNFFLIVGAILTGIGTIIYSVGSHEFILFFARILTGIGDATIWVNLVLILSQWFNAKEFTRLIGVAGMTGSLGFLMATVPFSAFIILVGWRRTFLLAGILLCLCGILLYFVLVKKPNKPLFEKREMRRENTWVILRRVLSNRQAWAIFFSHFGVVGAYLGLIGSWAVPYGMEMYGLTRIDASQLIMISLVGALIGAPFLSWLASRLRTIKRPFVIFHIVMLLCWSTILIFHGKPPFLFLVMIMFIIGFAFGSNSLTFALVRISFPVNESGIVSGFANTGGFMSAVLLPGIFGKILDHFQNVGELGAGYFYGFITPVIFSVIGLVGVIFIKESP